MTGTLLYDAAPGAALPPRDVRPGRRARGRVLRSAAVRDGELAVGRAGLDAFLAPRLGLEPLEPGALTGPALRALARGVRAPIKAFLLDQRRIAGVGNIYADEALFRAQVHPLRPAGSLRPAQYAALAEAVVQALRAGLNAGGATIDDFRHPDGVSGAFQHEFLVHLRRGEPCGTCGTQIVKLVAAGRGTYVCERCQTRPRLRQRPAAPAGGPSGRPRASR
jgi:formamidopyrimidine-DNA glycosylase